MTQVQATIARQDFTLDRREIEGRLKDELPEPLDDHYVVIGGRRFPPKQVISVVTGLDRADFNTHQARRVLSRVGFSVGRRRELTDRLAVARTGEGPHRGREAEVLRPFAGQWVAQRGLEVLVAAESPEAVVSWLERHGQRADAMFRVPSSEVEVTGLAPT